MAHVLWTYVANFDDEARYVEELNDPVYDVYKGIRDRWNFYSEDFHRKAIFHIFYENGDYEKAAAKDIFSLTSAED
jgi:hypothetical protein